METKDHRKRVVFVSLSFHCSVQNLSDEKWMVGSVLWTDLKEPQRLTAGNVETLVLKIRATHWPSYDTILSSRRGQTVILLFIISITDIFRLSSFQMTVKSKYELAIPMHSAWLKKLAPINLQPMRSQREHQNQSQLVRTFLPVLWASYRKALGVLIGSFECLLCCDWLKHLWEWFSTVIWKNCSRANWYCL